MHISEAQHKTASEFIELSASKLGSECAVHPETAIAGAARLAGSLHSLTMNAVAIAQAQAASFSPKDIGAEVGFNIAAFGFVERSKTVPPVLAADWIGETTPWYKFW